MADIAVDWAVADGDSSAGRIGLGSAVLAAFVIGEELPVGGSPLDRLWTDWACVCSAGRFYYWSGASCGEVSSWQPLYPDKYWMCYINVFGLFPPG